MSSAFRLWLALLALLEAARRGERRPEQELRIRGPERELRSRATILWTDRATILWTDRGQSAVELIGVLALVALIVLALVHSELLSGARRAVSEAVGNLFGAPR